MATRRFPCPSCGKTLKVDDALLAEIRRHGKGTHCPRCKSAVSVEGLLPPTVLADTRADWWVDIPNPATPPPTPLPPDPDLLFKFDAVPVPMPPDPPPSVNETEIGIPVPAAAGESQQVLPEYGRRKPYRGVRKPSPIAFLALLLFTVIEIVSPGNKSTRHALRKFVEKAADLLEHGVHLLIVDLLPPRPRDPHGIRAAIWDEVAGQEFVPPAGQPLTLAAYETDLAIRAFVRPVAAGDALPEMTLFLRPNGCVEVPTEATYQTAFAAMPRRWRRVLEATA